MVEINNINNILTQVNTIVTSYEKVAQATGENFNIFSVLGIEHYEVGTHSKFLAHLLNSKGNHGLGHRFLELFLIKIGAQEHLDFKTASCEVEYHIGKKSIKDCKNIKLKGMKMGSEGGSIDIYLWDTHGKSISIENKIYAEDQEKQIVRFYNYNKGNNRVLYLTLDRKDASVFSKGALISNIDEKPKEDEEPNFYCISYKDTILNWLESCQKEASDIPILRETIKQYKNLIKKLTHQNINSQMNEEIIKLITQSENNIKSAKTISSSIDSIKSKLIDKLYEIIKNGVVIKNSYEEISIFNHIKLLEPFSHLTYKVIRFDFFPNVDEKTEYICYEINTNSKVLKLKPIIYGKGKYYEKLNRKMTENISFLNLAEINYDEDINKIMSQIESNFIAINDFLKVK